MFGGDGGDGGDRGAYGSSSGVSTEAIPSTNYYNTTHCDLL